MPVVHRLPNGKIVMYPRDHPPPHVHILFTDGREVLVEIESGRIIAQDPVRRAELSMALSWIQTHSRELMARFKELQC